MEIVFESLSLVAIGYEADVEHEQHNEMEQGTSYNCRGEGGRLGFNFPYHVPCEVQQRIWTTVPLEHCIELFSKTLHGKIDKNRFV